MKVLHFNRESANYAGVSVEIFNIRWDIRTRKWVETTNPNARWGFHHPDTNDIIALKRRDLSYYGVVNEIEVPMVDVETKVEMGTPTLVTLSDEEE